ncbi:MAG: tRNA lysidine(34) synthetase TilS [Candidatus Omnitrophica bacterium]|nr:tRNA lysidine(34) synthetase TilS [Candidatus Omnitrophota bacterium]
MLKKIKHTINKFHLLRKGDTVLIACSGGPDSICLLLALYYLKKEIGINLCAAHLNHCLRGAESDKDELYVKKITSGLSIPLFTQSADANAFARKNKLSLEDAARRIRYGFLADIAGKIKANKIATAHTNEDQAETVLMRLLKGSGLRGLCGIPVKRQLDKNILVVRPMLETSKKEILSFLKIKRIKPRYDSSNLKDVFLRNKIRNKLIPYIEKNFSPQIKNILAKAADNVATDYEYLLGMQKNIFDKTAVKSPGKTGLSLEKIKFMHPSLKRGVVRLAIENVKGNLNKIDYRHWDEIEDLISKRKLNSQVHLPGGISVVKKSRTLDFLIKTNAVKKIIPAPIEIKQVILKCPPKTLGKSKNVEYFDADRIAFPLKIRFRESADKMKPLGMKQHKRLQDIFVDDKIDSDKRGAIPVVVDATGRIVWVYGVRMSEDFKITPSTKKYLRMSIY